MSQVSNDYDDLDELAGYPFPVYVSADAAGRATAIADRCEGAQRFYAKTFGIQARIRVLILAPAHWSRYTEYPVYGMPHCIDSATLVVAGENNGFWQSMIPPLETLTPVAAEAARAAYGLPDGSLDYSPFFDLLTAHEIAHLFHGQAALHFPRHWLSEFFCNLSLHALVSAESPDELSTLETLPRLVIGGDSALPPHHSLADFERLYLEMDAQNYGWYQCHLHVAARTVYDAGGITALQRLWRAFAQPTPPYTDEQLADYLSDAVHPQMKQIITQWPTETAHW